MAPFRQPGATDSTAATSAGDAWAGNEAIAEEEKPMVRIDASGKRRNRQESARVREALSQGYEVQFETPDQWRYYHRQQA
jgi:hypothetical protein